jgi:site-specific recombinase XerD
MTINSRLTYINKYLKEVCKYAGILKKISSHCARHTFSDISLELNQNDVYALKGVLGHSSVKTTEGYLINRNYDNIKEYLLTLQKLQISD